MWHVELSDQDLSFVSMIQSFGVDQDGQATIQAMHLLDGGMARRGYGSHSHNASFGPFFCEVNLWTEYDGLSMAHAIQILKRLS